MFLFMRFVKTWKHDSGVGEAILKSRWAQAQTVGTISLNASETRNPGTKDRIAAGTGAIGKKKALLGWQMPW